MSYRFTDDYILITASGVRKAFLTQDDFAVVNLRGDVCSGEPSSEYQMHLEVYRQSPEAKAVIHAHPPTAIAWSVCQPELKELPRKALAELILNVGTIPITRFVMPGTSQMGEALRELLPQNRVMILARHGALSWGESLTEAECGMERIEHTAEILFRAKALGGISELSDEVMKELDVAREKLGVKSS